MKVTVKTIDDCCEQVNLECTPLEWLIVSKAMHVLKDSDKCHPEDKAILEKLVNVEPVFEEKE